MLVHCPMEPSLASPVTPRLRAVKPQRPWRERPGYRERLGPRPGRNVGWCQNFSWTPQKRRNTNPLKLSDRRGKNKHKVFFKRNPIHFYIQMKLRTFCQQKLTHVVPCSRLGRPTGGWSCVAWSPLALIPLTKAWKIVLGCLDLACHCALCNGYMINT